MKLQNKHTNINQLYIKCRNQNIMFVFSIHCMESIFMNKVFKRIFYHIILFIKVGLLVKAKS